MPENEPAPGWDTMTPAQVRRWDAVLGGLADALSPGPRRVVVDGHRHTRLFADRLAQALASVGQECARLRAASPAPDEDHWRTQRATRTVALADGASWRARPLGGSWDVVIWLRTAPPVDHQTVDGERHAQVVVDLHDPAWPVLRHIDADLADRGTWYIGETRAFFAARASTWDTKFGDDRPAYAAAVRDAGVPVGGHAIDVGCGTGRALPALRAAVGPLATVIGLDITDEMLAAAREHSGAASAHLVLADARHLPLPDAAVDVVFAAGLISHLPDVDPSLAELARVTKAGGRLVLFHPSGRAALAARHGRALSGGEPLAEARLRPGLARAGWALVAYEDPPERFFALARRQHG